MRELFYNPSKLTMALIGALIILKAFYLIFLTNLQNTSAKRSGMFKVLRLLIYLVVTPAFLIIIASCIINVLQVEEFITLENVYWKAIIVVFCLFCFILYYFRLIPLVKKALRFFRKKDRNETKYQSIFKRTRSLIIVLIVLDIALIGYLNYIAV